MDEAALRREIVESARRMNALGINQGTSGNISARCGDHMLITPSAVPYDDMRPESIAAMSAASVRMSMPSSAALSRSICTSTRGLSIFRSLSRKMKRRLSCARATTWSASISATPPPRPRRS